MANTTYIYILIKKYCLQVPNT